MLYTLAGAAKASGLGECAILSAIERGEITGIKDLFGEWQIEDTEIHRLFFPIGQGGVSLDRDSGVACLATTEGEIGAPAQEAVQDVQGCGDSPAECPRDSGKKQRADSASEDPRSCSSGAAETGHTQGNAAPPALWECSGRS